MRSLHTFSFMHYSLCSSLHSQQAYTEYQLPLGSTATVGCRASTLAGKPTRDHCAPSFGFLALDPVSWALVASGSLIISSSPLCLFRDSEDKNWALKNSLSPGSSFGMTWASTAAGGAD